MNWYIGQKIVCIKNHSQGVVKKGEKFTILGLTSFGCKHIAIDVGIAGEKGNMICGVCNSIKEKNPSAWWFNDTLFAPIEEIPESHSEAIKELLKEKLVITE